MNPPDPNALYTKDYVTFAFASLAFIISLGNLLVPQLRDWVARRTEVLKALRGERQAIADVAEKVARDEYRKRLKKDTKFRTGLIKALCMAYAVEGADRAKAFVFAALHHLKSDKDCMTEITSQLTKLEQAFATYYAQIHSKDFKDKRLVPLQTLMVSLVIPRDPVHTATTTNAQSTGT
jgi:hypothetical protein